MILFSDVSSTTILIHGTLQPLKRRQEEAGPLSQSLSASSRLERAMERKRERERKGMEGKGPNRRALKHSDG